MDIIQDLSNKEWVDLFGEDGFKAVPKFARESLYREDLEEFVKKYSIRQKNGFLEFLITNGIDLWNNDPERFMEAFKAFKLVKNQ